MANPEHVEIVKKGSAAIAAWRTTAPNACFDLDHAVLTGARLRGANLTGANLTGVHLAGAHMRGANLKDANLKEASLAVWDVLASCAREGSLDKDIKSPKTNDLVAFHDRHPELRAVLLNGSAASKYFKRFVGEFEGVHARVMPSTSPALARKGKIEAWRQALEEVLQSICPLGITHGPERQRPLP